MISCGTNKMKKRSVSNNLNKNYERIEAIDKVSMPIFEKVLKETSKNHVSVGSGRVDEEYSYSFYNPHNARYYFKFDRKNISKKPRGGVGSFHNELRVINSTELCNGDFMGCRVVVKKKLIEVTNKINKERLFKIDGSENNRSKLVKESVSILMHECIDVLYKFIKIYGGNSNYICVNHHVLDNKIVHDKVIDSMPSKLTFRNDIAKNVYKTNPSNVEFSDPVFASNYFRNMGLNDYSPAIANELSNLKKEINEVRKSYREDIELFKNEALIPLTEQIKTHLAVQHSTLKLQEHSVELKEDNMELNKVMSNTLKEIRDNYNKSNKIYCESRAKKLLRECGW